MTKDEVIFLVERYGYARREGECQGKRPAEWMREIGQALDTIAANREAQEPLAMLRDLLFWATHTPSGGEYRKRRQVIERAEALLAEREKA